MKIQCDVCEKAQATVICCADEAALCAKCDVEVHAANKLASKHQRLLLQCLSDKLPPCDICQEKTAFIFCVEDRALFCKDCDEPIHSANSRSANHQRFLATGIRVSLSSNCKKETFKSQMDPNPPKFNSQDIELKTNTHHVPGVTSPAWAVEDFLQFSDNETFDKKKQLEFNELAWFTDMNVFGSEEALPEALAAAEVPQIPIYQPTNHMSSYRSIKSYSAHKKPRIEIQDEDEEACAVPDLGLSILDDYQY